MWYRKCGAEYLQLTIGWVCDFPTQWLPEEIGFYLQIVERKCLQIWTCMNCHPKSIFLSSIYGTFTKSDHMAC